VYLIAEIHYKENPQNVKGGLKKKKIVGELSPDLDQSNPIPFM
jgi:hypothetical protein